MATTRMERNNLYSPLPPEYYQHHESLCDTIALYTVYTHHLIITRPESAKALGFESRFKRWRFTYLNVLTGHR